MSELSIIFKILLTVFLCGIIGYNREVENKPAGFRTNVLVGLGSALAMMLSLQIGEDRIASSVLTGIGFLGGGVFIAMRKNGGSNGLTTAATLWTVAVIGLGVGYGMYFASIATTAVAYILLRYVHDDTFKRNSHVEYEQEKSDDIRDV